MSKISSQSRADWSILYNQMVLLKVANDICKATEEKKPRWHLVADMMNHILDLDLKEETCRRQVQRCKERPNKWNNPDAYFELFKIANDSEKQDADWKAIANHINNKYSLKLSEEDCSEAYLKQASPQKTLSEATMKLLIEIDQLLKTDKQCFLFNEKKTSYEGVNYSYISTIQSKTSFFIQFIINSKIGRCHSPFLECVYNIEKTRLTSENEKLPISAVKTLTSKSNSPTAQSLFNNLTKRSSPTQTTPTTKVTTNSSNPKSSVKKN